MRGERRVRGGAPASAGLQHPLALPRISRFAGRVLQQGAKRRPCHLLAKGSAPSEETGLTQGGECPPGLGREHFLGLMSASRGDRRWRQYRRRWLGLAGVASLVIATLGLLAGWCTSGGGRLGYSPFCSFCRQANPNPQAWAAGHKARLQGQHDLVHEARRSLMHRTKLRNQTGVPGTTVGPLRPGTLADKGSLSEQGSSGKRTFPRDMSKRCQRRG